MSNFFCYTRNQDVIGTMVTANAYLQMLQEFAIDNIPLQIRRAGYFQQDGSLLHFAHTVCTCLDQNFPNHWIDYGGPLSWPPHSPDLTPYDFWLWGKIKDRVYSKKVRDIDVQNRRCNIKHSP